MESAAEFGYPNASEIAQPQESEEHVWAPPCLFLPSPLSASASLWNKSRQSCARGRGARGWEMCAQSHPRPAPAVTPMGDRERCHPAQRHPPPHAPGGRVPEQSVSAFPLSRQPLECCSSTSKGPVRVALRQPPSKPLLSIFRDKIRHQSDWFPALHVKAECGGRWQPTHPPSPTGVWLHAGRAVGFPKAFLFFFSPTLSPSCWQPSLIRAFEIISLPLNNNKEHPRKNVLVPWQADFQWEIVTTQQQKNDHYRHIIHSISPPITTAWNGPINTPQDLIIHLPPIPCQINSSWKCLLFCWMQKPAC